MPPDLIEGPEQRRDRIRDELKQLREHIDSEKAVVDTEKTAIDDAATAADVKEAKTAALRTRVQNIKTRVEQDVARWREEIGSGNPDEMAKLDALQADLMRQLEAIDTTTAAQIQTRVDTLKARLEEAEKNDGAAPVSLYEELEDLKRATVSDVLPPEPDEEPAEGFMGVLQKLGKMLKPLMKMFRKMQIGFSKMQLGLGLGMDAAEKEQLKREIEQAENEYAAEYGGEDLRVVFDEQVKSLKPRRLEILPGAQDGAAVRRFDEKFEAYRRANRGLKKDVFVKAMLDEYVAECGVTLDEFKKADHATTLWGILNGEKPQAGVESVDLLAGDWQAVVLAGEAYKLKIDGNNVSVDKEGAINTKQMKMYVWIPAGSPKPAGTPEAPSTITRAAVRTTGELELGMTVTFRGNHDVERMFDPTVTKALVDAIAAGAVTPIAGSTAAASYEVAFE